MANGAKALEIDPVPAASVRSGRGARFESTNNPILIVLKDRIWLKG